MRILTINCGSSSIKFRVFDDDNEIISGLVDAISLGNSKITYKFNNEIKNIEKKIEDHSAGIREMLKILEETIKINTIDAVAHRVVHGGEYFKESTIINEEVLQKLKELIPLAPLHNPKNILGIEEISKHLEEIPQIAIFDTAFHSTIPKKAYIYGIPYEYYEKYKIRRYGFHGTSHKFVSSEARRIFPELKKIISCHLGNGASITAIKDGKSVDTSMGFTPLEGLVMGTRCGDIDPAIIPFLMEKENLSAKQIDEILNKKSGLLGISKLSSDMRILLSQKEENENADLAIKVFLYRVSKYIGAYAAALNGVDAIIFTGGMGENNSYLRSEILKQLTYLGIKIDENANEKNETVISSNDSKVKVLVIKTNEELEMAREARELLN
ncbi:MAG: acetate kinase, partial [Candidatus Woesearchaeota archaeon]|nr:acetate kinase [Candidatus Woesearchaeota archaeon]